MSAQVKVSSRTPRAEPDRTGALTERCGIGYASVQILQNAFSRLTSNLIIFTIIRRLQVQYMMDVGVVYSILRRSQTYVIAYNEVQSPATIYCSFFR